MVKEQLRVIQACCQILGDPQASDGDVSLPPATTVPTKPTNQPTNNQPTDSPTHQPNGAPTNQPTNQPSNQPTNQPGSQPASQPTNKCLSSSQCKASKTYFNTAARKQRSPPQTYHLRKGLEDSFPEVCRFDSPTCQRRKLLSAKREHVPPTHDFS